MKTKNKIKLFYLIIACLSINLLISCKTKDEKYRIKKGAFSSTIIETGEVQSVSSEFIVMPSIDFRFGWDGFKIIELKDHGTYVNAGDIVAVIDKAPIMKVLIVATSNLEIEKANLNKLIIENNITNQNLKTELIAQEASYNMSKLQLEKYKYETIRKKEIQKLNLDKAEIELEKIKTKNKLNSIISQKKIFIQKIKVKQIEQLIDKVNEEKLKLTLISPINGYIQLSRNWRSNQTIKIGDDVWRGMKIASIPNLSKMKIKAKIAENDIYKIKLNQPVLVRLDAYPVKSFDGTITKINSVCYKKERESTVKVFDFEVLLDKTDPILKPGMTASCEIMMSINKDVLYVENNCIFSADSCYYVFLEKGNKKIKVDLGPKNNNYTVISGDIKKGQKLLTIEQLNAKK